ncbi:MAG: diguanylate cyclase [Lachnospiraceae bacterium]|nr:diguanylate cyclase [Lachnospiraceae bacterium]
MTKILIVDDEPMMLMVTKRILSQNYEVICANSGAAAIDLFEKEKPALILSDLLMPEMSGFEMYQKMQEKTGEKVPIIYMTADDAEETEGKSFDLGAQDFIHKPFKPDILLRRVDNVLGNLEKINNLTEEIIIDKLTGVLNKNGANSRLEKVCAENKGILSIIDLDSFKLVNDIYGHEAGDRILIGFAEIIKNNTESGDIVGRIGGDEFIAFLDGVDDEAVMAGLSARVNDRLFKLALETLGSDMKIPLGASFGAVKVPDYGTDYAELFKMADKALYYVKQNGKHGYSLYSKSSVIQIEGDPVEEMKKISKLLEERNTQNCAFWLGQDAFSAVYRFMLRYISSYNGVAYKLLFDVLPDEGIEDADYAAAIDLFGDLLNKSLRKSDIMMQSKPNQFFLLLPEISEEFIENVIDRIIKQWKASSNVCKVKLVYEKEILSKTEAEEEERRLYKQH